jgi:hydroxymethylpyrimidine pyrophosphatase-like HAD family hydrolase
MKKLIVFDLDGTLAESKSSLDAEMATLLNALLGIVKVAVISGGAWPQFEKQLLANLSHDEKLKNLSLLPTCGTKFYKHTLKILPMKKRRRSSAHCIKQLVDRILRSNGHGENRLKTEEARLRSRH